MTRYLEMIQSGVFLLVFAMGFNNCTKVAFNDAGTDSTTKVQGLPGIEQAAVDQSNCVGDDDDDNDDGVDDDDDDNSCYAICHVPPGNYLQRHTIYIGLGAIRAHLENHISHDDVSYHDEAGECEDNNEGIADDGENEVVESPDLGEV